MTTTHIVHIIIDNNLKLEKVETFAVKTSDLTSYHREFLIKRGSYHNLSHWDIRDYMETNDIHFCNFFIHNDEPIATTFVTYSLLDN